MAFYCINCLAKYKTKQLHGVDNCPNCGVALRSNKPRIVAQVVARLRRLRGFEIPKRRVYEDYLKSVLWKTIRARVLMRDGGKCQACSLAAEVVHHKSYRLDVIRGCCDIELVSLCHNCHLAIEFDFVDGCHVKNSLEEANRKLEQMILKNIL